MTYHLLLSFRPSRDYGYDKSKFNFTVQNGIEILQRAEKSIYAHNKLLHYRRNYTDVFHDPETGQIFVEKKLLLVPMRPRGGRIKCMAG